MSWLRVELIGAVLISATQVTDSNYLNKINKGKDLASAGVIIQLVAFGLFTLVGIRFHFVSKRFINEFKRRFQTNPGDKFITLEGSGRKFRSQWRQLLYAVNIACAMILVGCSLSWLGRDANSGVASALPIFSLGSSRSELRRPGSAGFGSTQSELV
jgi:predicted permease